MFFYLSLILLFGFCSNPNDKAKIKELSNKVAKLDSINNILLYEKEHKADIEKQRLDSLKKMSQGLVLNGRIQVVNFATGFDPDHNNDGLWLPCVTLMFKNVSNDDLISFIKVRAVFINNTTSEQISEDYEFLCTDSRPFLSATKKQITLESKIGWYAIQNQDVSVRISIEKEQFKTYKIANQYFSGRIN